MSDFRIKSLTVGQIETNCYILYQEGKKHAVIADPGGSGPLILNQCRELGLVPEAILLTHGHFDHMMAVEDLKRAFPDVCVYVHEKETKLLEDPQLNLSKVFGCTMMVRADKTVRDGEVLDLAGGRWKVIDTPGHTCGSVSYYNEDEGVLLSGDTLFEESLGRTDFPTGSVREITVSIQEKLFTLPEDTMVYPGHGGVTTIGHERLYNPVASYR